MTLIAYHEFQVQGQDAGDRLDKVLGRQPGCSRTLARRLIAAGAVFVNGRRVKQASEPMSAGQTVRAPSALPDLPDAPPPIRVLRQWAGFLAVDKPEGVPSAPTPLGDRGCLPERLRQQLGLAQPPLVVHRLDVDVTGVILLALDRDAAHDLSDAFAAGRLTKWYRALVASPGPDPEGLVEAPLGRDPARRGRMRVDHRGDPARTGYRVLGPLPGYPGVVQLDVRLFTGRTHQIRVHLAHLGCPILGDRWYGGPRLVTSDTGARIPVPRLCLHAHRLILEQPRGAPLELVAEVPGFLP